jgi:hypothetical protein
MQVRAHIRTLTTPPAEPQGHPVPDRSQGHAYPQVKWPGSSEPSQTQPDIEGIETRRGEGCCCRSQTSQTQPDIEGIETLPLLLFRPRGWDCRKPSPTSRA